MKTAIVPLGCHYRESAQPIWKWPSPLRPFSPESEQRISIPIITRRLVGRFWSVNGDMPDKV
jgi:hypothetical protein